MFYKILKRLIDIIVGCCALLVTFPIMLLIMLILKFTGEGKVFFSQQRMGYQNKPFSLVKFRSMVSGKSSKGAVSLTTTNDPRVTPFGHFLRSTKLDELPQFLLVAKGKISLVGPRPKPIPFFHLYPKDKKYLVYQVKPGITGCLLYTSPSPRDLSTSRMPSSA